MCTLSVITRDDGYLLGMNRDERLTRAEAYVPATASVQGTMALYPRDGEGGTWIAVNDRGIALALLNWNDPPQPGGDKVRSRGEVIPAVVAQTSHEELSWILGGLDLCGTWPFRLVGIFPAEKVIGEWRWTGHKLEANTHEWRARHWFSSSMSDTQATAERGAVCEGAWKAPDAGSARWLRALHASHDRGPGPFSLCVHRTDVATLSYTEIECTAATVEMVYRSGSPCETGDPVASIRVERRSSSVAEEP